MSFLAPSGGHDGPVTLETADSGAPSPGHDPGSRSAPAVPRSAWDALDEEGRRAQLDAMDPDTVRALAASMPVIEQAKGVVMGCFGCDPAAAFTVLVRASSSRNVKLRDLAILVVRAASVQPPAVEPGTSTLDRVRRVLAGDGLAVDDGRGFRA